MKKPSSVAIFIKPGCDDGLFYTKRVISLLAPYGITVLLDARHRASFNVTPDSVRFLPDEQTMIETAEMMLVLGGDGTMIRYGVRAAVLSKPTVGVNLGTLGFLTALERTELEKLSAIGTGDYTIEQRMLLDAEIRDAQGSVIHRQHVLNDVVLASGLRSRIAEFALYSQNGMILDYRADGVIVATPTGSTAYSFSAGGPVIDPTAEIISVTPLCPHTLLRGSVLLAPDTELRISGKTRDENTTDVHVTMDGKNSRLIPPDASVHIIRSPHTLGIVKIGPNRFYDILETKLNKK